MRKIICVGLLLLSLTLTTAAQDEPAGCGSEFDLPIWQVDDGNCNFKQEVTISVSISYPEAFNQYLFARDILLDYLNQRQMEFWSIMSGGYFGPEGAGMSLDIQHEEYQFALSVISVVFTGYSYTGGAHGNDDVATFTFDLANETVLTLDDIFVDTPAALQVVFPLVKTALMEQMTDMADEQWITEGTGEKPENYQNFALTADSIIFFFPSYQVAPYAAGPQQVTIPLADLKDVLEFRFALQ